jgi:hypothetical protein
MAVGHPKLRFARSINAVFYGEIKIGTVVRESERWWRAIAMDRTVASFRTRGAAGVWLIKQHLAQEAPQ